MTVSYDLTTTVGQMRLLLPDRPVYPDGTTDTANVLFTDEEHAQFYALEDNLRRAVALAVETVASDQALLLKYMRSGDFLTDGAKVSAELRARAKDLRAQAAFVEDEAGAFDYAEMVLDPATARARLRAQALRGLE